MNRKGFSVFVVVLAICSSGCPALFQMDAGLVSAQADTLDWPRPRVAEFEEERHRLVERGVKRMGVRDEAVLEAMRNVPRHLFVPEVIRDRAYENAPLPIGYGQTISQPYIVAYMCAALELKPGDKVLEIGTGSGYHAAVLSELTPHVYTIEIVEELGKRTAALLKELGYETIQTKIGDGYHGWAEYSPYDAVIVTAAPEDIPQPLIEQLAPGGIMIIPVGDSNQTQMLVKVTKGKDGKIRSRRELPVRFVPMTGEAQEQ